MPRKRLGVALLVPPPHSVELDGLRKALGDAAVNRIPPHLTLVPPVNVPEADLDKAVTVMREAAAESPRLRCELGPATTFWPDSPVIYLEVTGDLEGIHSLRGRLFAPPLERDLSWPFVPHVTLLDEADAGSIAPACASIAGYRAAVVFEGVHLLEEGPDRVWRTFADARFGGRALVSRGGLPLELSTSERPDGAASAWASREWDAYDVANLGFPDRPFAVTARREGAVVGLAEGAVRGGVCELSRLIVDGGSRDQGVGTQLVLAVESLAAREGCRSCRLRTEEGAPGQRFFAGRGWTVSARLPGWRAGRDFVVMKRPLG